MQQRVERKHLRFTKLLITSFALPFNKLTDTLSRNVLSRYKDYKLFAPKENPNAPDEPLLVDKSLAIFVTSTFYSEPLVYEPEEFSENHRGKTKEEVILKTGAWQVSFIQDTPFLPSGGKIDLTDRTPLFSKKRSPSEYLALLQTDPQFLNETGITPEDWMTYFLLHLEETGHVVDMYSDVNSSKNRSLELGAYFTQDKSTPVFSWSHNHKAAWLSTHSENRARDFNGLRTRVRI